MAIIHFHSSHFISAAAKNNMTKYGVRILLLLCVVGSPAHAKSTRNSENQPQNTEYAKQFNTELFSKCNTCHKPFESTIVGSRTVPSYIAMAGMGQSAIEHGIDYGGHLSSADKSKIYSIIHPSAEPRQVKKVATKKVHKPRKHGRPKKRN